MADRSNEPKVDAEDILAGILRWVGIETHSHDGAAVNRLADMIAGEFAGLGAAIERIPGRDGFGDVLIAHAPCNRSEERRVGKEGVSTGSYRWSPYNYKKQKK